MPRVVLLGCALALLFSATGHARKKGEDIYVRPAPDAKTVKKIPQKKARKKRRRRVRRSLASRQWRDRPPWRVGVEGTGDGLLGLVSNGLTSAGIGFGGGLHVMGGFARRWQFTFGVGFRSLGLVGSLDGTGVIEDPALGTVSQRQFALSGRLLVGYYLTPARPARNEATLWLDGGVEFLYALVAAQTSTLPGGNQVYRPPNLLLVRLGPSGSLRLSRQWNLASSLHLFYNLASTGNARLTGAQLSLALQLTL